MTEPKKTLTTEQLSRELLDLCGMPDSQPPTTFDTQAPAAVPDEEIDPELIDFALDVDSALRDHEAREAATNAINKAREQQ